MRSLRCCRAGPHSRCCNCVGPSWQAPYPDSLRTPEAQLFARCWGMAEVHRAWPSCKELRPGNAATWEDGLDPSALCAPGRCRKRALGPTPDESPVSRSPPRVYMRRSSFSWSKCLRIASIDGSTLGRSDANRNTEGDRHHRRDEEATRGASRERCRP